MTTNFAFTWLFAQAERAPDAPFLGTPTGWLNYAEFALRTSRLARSMADAGLGRGDVLLSALANSPACVAASLAASSLGACVAELSPDVSDEALRAACVQTGARHAVFSGRVASHVGQLGLQHAWVVHPQPPTSRLGAAIHAPYTWLREDAAIDSTKELRGPGPSSETDPALLVYTSGSTGSPRAVTQTHRNLGTNSRAIAAYLELAANDRACLILPLHYCYGMSVLYSHLLVGGSVFLDHRFMYPRVVLEAIGSEGCTGFAGVPLTFELLRRQVDVTGIEMPSLRYVTQAGGAMHPETIDWARAAFAPARLFVMYGQTEATARLTYLAPEHAVDKRGSVGVAVQGVELRIFDDAGEELPPGQVGHVVARGGSITPGYYRESEATSEILKNGWLWTGDLGYRDADGFLFITGRTKEILKLGGHRVTAREIEEALASLPGVAEVAVAGTPDDVAGEAAVAYVVKQPGAELSQEDVRRGARDRLASYKVPRDVVFTGALPRTATGKIARSELSKIGRQCNDSQVLQGRTETRSRS